MSKTRNLQIRMRGQDVAQLQQMLRELGYVIEDRQGYFGRSTQQAVCRIQSEHGYPPTGIVTSNLRERINRLLIPGKESNDIEINSFKTQNPYGSTVLPSPEYPLVNKYYGLYRGVVSENIDPLGIMRIKVHVPDVLGAQECCWAQPCLPPGIREIPAIGAHVWIQFERGEADKPVWIGLLPGY